MKILDIEIEDDQITVIVDDYPIMRELTYEHKNGCYYAQTEGGYVHFLYHSGSPEKQNGYGGIAFELPMVDGTTKTLIGPWSSRAAAMNEMGFGPCVGVRYRRVNDTIATFSAMELNTLQDALSKHTDGTYIIQKDGYEWVVLQKEKINS